MVWRYGLRLEMTTDTVALVRAYYRALEQGDDLATFYATDDEAGVLGPVVKIGSGAGELYTGYEATAAAVRQVSDTFAENALESRGPLLAREVGDVAWFVDTVWWRGRVAGRQFGSLTRWTGVCLRTPRGWRFVQLHVSGEVEE